MSTILTTPEQMAVFHLMQCIGALRIEVRTGMRHSRGSVLKTAQNVYGVRSRTKAGALAELLALYEEVTGREYGSK
jgi:hypothetical protein